MYDAARVLHFRPMFDTLTNRLGDVFTRLRGKGRLSEADVDAMVAAAARHLNAGEKRRA